MNRDDLISVLRDIRDLADKALRADGAAPKARGKNKQAAKAASSTPDRLPDRIIRLRDTSYLKQPKTVDEIHLKLQDTYHCDRDRVSMALLRLLKRKLVRKTFKTADDKKKIAYVW
jgi:hypothetical protein